MALNDDLDRQPIPPPIYGVVFGLRVVTLSPGEQLVHIGGWLWLSGRADPYFGTGSRTFRELKAIGDLQERLRTGVVPLRRDLATEHFDGRKRVHVEGIVVETIKAYAGHTPALDAEVFYIPGQDDADCPPGGRRKAVRVVRRVLIK